MPRGRNTPAARAAPLTRAVRRTNLHCPRRCRLRPLSLVMDDCREMSAGQECYRVGMDGNRSAVVWSWGQASTQRWGSCGSGIRRPAYPSRTVCRAVTRPQKRRIAPAKSRRSAGRRPEPAPRKVRLQQLISSLVRTAFPVSSSRSSSAMASSPRSRPTRTADAGVRIRSPQCRTPGQHLAARSFSCERIAARNWTSWRGGWSSGRTR